MRRRSPAAHSPRLLVVLALLMVVAGGFAESASASHMRFRNVTWTRVSGNQVKFTETHGYACSTFSEVGADCATTNNTFTSEALNYGDGTVGGTSYTISAKNLTDNWLTGTRQDTKTYSTSANYTAYTTNCCTISTLLNNHDGDIRAQTLVTSQDNESPVTSMPSVVDVGNSGVQTWSIPAADAGGQTLRWRLATAAEACGACTDPQPTGLTIAPTTGVVSWNTTGKTAGLYFSSVIIEALNSGGTVVSSTQATYIIRVSTRTNNTAPDWSSPTPASGSTYTVDPGQTVALTFKATDPDTTDVVHVDRLALPTGATFASTDGNPGTGTFSWTPTAAQAGQYLFTVTAQDNKGASATARTYTINVRNTAPTAPGEPVGLPTPSRTGALTVNWAASTDVDPGDAVTYKLEAANANGSGTYQTLATGLTTNSTTVNLAEGRWRFRVTATDKAAGIGGPTTTTAANTSVVDKTAPATPSLAVTPGQIAYPVGGVDWYRGSVGLTLTANGDPALADGTAGTGVATFIPTSTVSVQGRSDVLRSVSDVAGNVSSAATRSVYVDNTAPVLSINNPNPEVGGWNTQSSVNLVVSASDTGGSGIATKACTDNGAPLAGFTVTGEGIHQITCTATDNVGFAFTSSRTVRIDSVGPVLSLPDAVSAAASGRHAATVTYVATAADAVTGPAAVTCTPPSGSDFALQQTIVSCFAIDGHGNRSDGTFAVDVTDPSAPTVEGAVSGTFVNGWVTSDAGVSWMVSDPESDIVSTTGCDPETVAYDTDGTAFTCSATSAGGTASGTVTVKRDTTAPSVGLTHAPDGRRGYNRTVPVALSASADDGPIGSGVGIGPDCFDVGTGEHVPVTGWSPTDGVYRVKCLAADLVGWVGRSDEDLITVDTTPPAISVTHVADGAHNWNTSDAVELDVAATDAFSGIDVRPACTDEGQPLLDDIVSGEGVHHISCRVADAAGNVSTATDVVKIDTIAPAVTATHDADGDNGWNRSGGVKVTPSATDDGSGVDGDPACTYPGGAPSVSGDGTHAVECSARDEAGNVGKVTETVKVDTTAPSTTDDAPATSTNAATTITLTAHDATSGVAATYVSVDGGPESAGSSVTIPAPADHSNDGGHVIRYRSVDAAGNREESREAVVVIDTITPESSDDAPGAWRNLPIEVNLTAHDGDSGLAQIYYAIDGADYVKGEHAMVDAPLDHSNDGVHTISYYAVDQAGNEEEPNTATVRIDTRKPSSSDDAPADWRNRDVTVNLTAADGDAGVDEIRAKVDGGAFAQAESVTIPAPADGTGDGEHTVTYYAVDRAGNAEDEHTATVRIDATAPQTSDDAPTAWQSGATTVKLTATDARSGVAGTRYTLDGGEPRDGDTVVVSGGGVHTIAYHSTDRAGNDSPTREATVRIDLADPSITGKQTPDANGFGWANRSVVVSFKCADADSGVSGCEPDVPLNDETTADGRTITGTASDLVGHTATASVGPVRIDKTAPSLSGAATTPPNALGWYADDVTVRWTAADGLSGIDPATAPADSVLTGEGGGLQAGPVSVADKAGNTTSARGPEINIDRTRPTITASTAPAAPNANGWFHGPVEVSFACDDTLSGVRECATKQVLSQDGTGQSASGTATDKAGNTRDASVTGIKIDSRAPQTVATVSCTKANGYCSGTSATVDLAATDPAPADGITASGVRTLEYRLGDATAWTAVTGDHVSVPVPLSGSGAARIEYRSTDAAGNTEPAGASRIDYDTIAPTVTHALDPAANAFGWNRGNKVTVHFAATDDLSGVDLASITPDQDVTGETAGQTVTGRASDRAGNVGTDAVTVKLDRTAPTISAALSGTQGENGWYTSAVTARFTCADGGAGASGVVSCPVDQVLDHTGTASGVARDKADNSATASAGPVKVDGAKPTVTVKGIAAGAIYTLGAVPAPSCSATDVGPSGLNGACAITVTGGLANGVGTFAFTAKAKDMAGNQTVVTGTYRVRYAVAAGTAFWLQPINDTAHTTGASTSVFKAGSTVPAKFRLTDATGKVVLANSAPVWLNPVKGSSIALPVDESVYGAAGTTGSVFTWTDGQYQFNWNTAKDTAGYYWRIGVRLDDGTDQVVNIGLR